jgi:adenylate cyclase
MRHLAMGGGAIHHLSDLRAPMTEILKSFTSQLAELQQYKARYGALEPAGCVNHVEELDDSSSETESETGSDTEQE